MSVRERSRYMTTAVVFLLAFIVLGALAARSAGVMALSFTWRPVGGAAVNYTGLDEDCVTPLEIAATQQVDFARDDNVITFSTSYADADLEGNGAEKDSDFNRSAGWIGFDQHTELVRNVNLFVSREAFDNQLIMGIIRQWKIEYTAKGAGLDDTDGWHEIVRFTIDFDTISGELTVDDEKVINTSKGDDVGFIKSLDGSTLVLERYHLGEFALWAVSDAIYNVDGSFEGQITSFAIDVNPSEQDLGPIFITDYEAETPLFVTGVPADSRDVEENVFVRVRSRQEGCVNSCPLCETDIDSLARLNIFDIRVEADWDTGKGGPQPLAISTQSLPDANVYANYDEDVEAIGGLGNRTWSIISGAPPNYFTNTTSGDSMNIGYTPVPPPPPPPTELADPGIYNFTVKVTDESTVPQTAQRNFSIQVLGLSIDPRGPELPVGVKGQAYVGQQFDPLGEGTPYYWCRTGTIPPGMYLEKNGTPGDDVMSCPDGGDPDTTPAYQADSHVTLSGTPTNDGVYSFTLKLTRDVGEVAVHDYTLEIKSAGVTLQPKKLKGYVKEITYGSGATDMEPEFIIASGIDTVGAAGNIYTLPVITDAAFPAFSNLGLNPGGTGVLPAATSVSFRIEILGLIGITEASGIYSFEAWIEDPGNSVAELDSQEYTLNILERKTLVLESPPSAVTLPSDYKLDFLVFGEGGAPSNVADTALDGKSTPYYNYDWLVTPVGDSTPLKASEADKTEPIDALPEPAPYTRSINFIDENDAPVTGTYDVIIRARDYLRRNESGPDYEFTPATVRVKVIAPGGRTLEKDVERPTKLKQERFR